MQGRWRNPVLLLLAWGLAVAAMVRQVLTDWAARGSPWRQGDWLINAEAGPVRRGLFGSGLIALSDGSGVPLLALAVALQLACLAAWIVALSAFALRAGPPDRLLLILLSPGFLLFWGSDPEGILRKEILVYLAFLPLVLAAGRPGGGRPLLALAVGLYALAAVGHEIAVFFAPAMILAMALCRRFDHASGLAMIAVAGLGAGSLVHALRHIGLPDAAPLCAPLLARGLLPEMCTGAIAWIAHDADYVRARLVETLHQPRGWTVPLAYAAALLPFAVALAGSPRPWRGALAILALGLPFFPLWAVAIDWGRWINAHVTVLVIVVLIQHRRGALRWALAPLPAWVMAAVLLPGVTLGIRHVGGRLIPGIVPLPTWLGFLP